MKTTEFLCTTRDGKDVYYDPVYSHTATHFNDQPLLRELVVEVLINRNVSTNSLEFDYDMQRIIGTTDVVSTDTGDDIVYAIRKQRSDQGYVPFTKSRPAEPSSAISIALAPAEDDTYTLVSAWIGRWNDPPFPEQAHATPDSIDYWKSHAFVWGSQQVEAGTERTDCPW